MEETAQLVIACATLGALVAPKTHGLLGALGGAALGAALGSLLGKRTAAAGGKA